MLTSESLCGTGCCALAPTFTVCENTLRPARVVLKARCSGELNSASFQSDLTLQSGTAQLPTGLT